MRWRLVLVLLAACGSSENRAGDAAGGAFDAPAVADAAGGRDATVDAVNAVDAMIDGMIADAAPPDAPAVGTITVRVARATVPQVGVLVIVQSDATAASAMELETDAAGELTTTITGGSYVSLINPGVLDPGDSNPTFDHVLTFSGVQPGEVLEIDYGGPPTPAQPSFTVTGLTMPPPSGAYVGTPCGGGLTTFGPVVTVSPSRHCEPTMPLVYIAVIGTLSGEFPVGSIYLGAAPSDGTPINVAATPFTPAIARQFSLVHANGASAQVSARTALLGAYPYDGQQATLVDNETTTLNVAGAVPAQYQMSSIQFFDPGGGRREAFLWGSAGALTFDAATFPPELSALTFVPATRSIHWTTAAGPTPDAVRTRVVSPGGAVVWDMMGPPPPSGSLTIPHLPAAHDYALPDESLLSLRALSSAGGLPLLRSYVGRQFNRIRIVAEHAAGDVRARSVGDLSFP
jgi:hypothetical protein